MILGLTGSYGSGKSTVADILKLSMNARIIDADQITRDLQRPGEAGYIAIRAEFGSEIIGEDGELDRKKLADIVFKNDEKLNKLNSIIHPMVWQTAEWRLKRLKNHRLVVFMVPLLFETGADRLCDKTAVVTVSADERVRRLMKRDGVTAEQIQERLAAQMPQQEKMDRADFVINNNGSLAKTLRQVQDMLNKLGLSIGQSH